MEYKEIKALYDKLHFKKDISEINREIIEISNLLNQEPFDMKEARKKVYEINNKHSENTVIHNFFFPMTGQRVSIGEADEQSLKNDLEWKRIYLISKSQAKNFDEFIKELNELVECKRSNN